MVWGKKQGVDDLVQKLSRNETGETMLILSNRSFGDKETIAFCKALATNTSLKELLCSGHPIGEEGAKNFRDALANNKSLTKLGLGNSNFGDKGVAALFANWENSTLTHIELEYKSLGQGAMEAISSALQRENALESILLGRNGLNDTHVEVLSKGIQASPSINHICLKSNVLSATGCKHVGDSLRLRDCEGFKLALDDNERIGCEGLETLVSGNGTGPVVTEMSLSGCGIGDDGVQALCASMTAKGSCFSSLQVLNISRNKLTESSAEAFGNALKHNEKLRKLYLARNAIKVDGFFKLSQNLGKLQLLDLSANGITSEDSGVLDSIMVNIAKSGLVELRLLGNKIGDAGALVVCKGLRANTTIKHLSLAGIELTAKGCEAILSELESNTDTALRILELGSNDLGDEGRLLVENFREKRPDIDVAMDKQGNTAEQ
uniref:Uncharacterized protein n=1 Tax=Mucochytrium quahogii TaxID=96639 RepID=A0A7S2SI57_9STRA|mmetsp:Transcript_8944/g.14546  ORF Transcript_8944/g.14546 Transcript_8944/m.14546 type:complete len:435 (+) Transcript_8944:79-1383(+)